MILLRHVACLGSVLTNPDAGARRAKPANLHRQCRGGQFVRPLAWLLLLFLAIHTTASASPSSMKALYRRCEAACVEVLMDGRHAGSGWFASRDGLVVTAAHLFTDAGDQPVELLAGDGSRTAATLAAIDRGHDLAVLRTAPRHDAHRFLPVSRKRPTVGEEIFQFGAPLFRPGVLQSGRIAANTTAFEYYGDLREYVEIVHVAGMMQGGTSGGPWLNAKGEVVGVQSGVMSLDGKPVGVAYMVPGEFIRNLLGTLRNAATPSLGLGVDELWQQSGDFLKTLPSGTQGLVVAVLQTDGPAAKAGIKPQDVITSVDGLKVIRIRELLRQIRSRKAGDEVTLEVLTPGGGAPVLHRVVIGCAETSMAPALHQP